jgi:C1A family cysteine protease
MIIQPRLGYVPDIEDLRDRTFSSHRFAMTPIKEETDLRHLFSPIEDQGVFSSCVGNASVGALEFFEIKEGIKFDDLSRMMAYYGARKMRHMEAEDNGCMIRDCVKFLANAGTCKEELWPHDRFHLFREPDEVALADARKHRMIQYQRISGRDQIQACLSAGFPVIFGMTLYEGYMNPDASGFVKYPNLSIEKVMGGHAQDIAGHNKRLGQYWIRNSWGESYGDHGYVRVDMDYVERCGSDYWAILGVEYA